MFPVIKTGSLMFISPGSIGLDGRGVGVAVGVFIEVGVGDGSSDGSSVLSTSLS